MPHSSQIPPELKQQAEDPSTLENRLPTVFAFRLMVFFAVIFCATVLALLTMLFGNELSPSAKWLDKNAAWLLTVEFAAIGACVIVGIVQQRRQAWMRYEAQLAEYNRKLAELEASANSEGERGEQVS